MRLFEKQAVILSSLLKAEEPIPGTVLSKKSSLSLKTVKKEIDLINDYAHTLGFQIVSHYGVGYEIEISDKPVYEQFRVSFLSAYLRNFYFKDNQNERVHYIVRRLLSNRGDLFIDDLADECCCSNSIINRDMIQVKAVLRDYDLTVRSRTAHGLALEGNEWGIRLALIREHKILKNFSKELPVQEDDFMRFFLTQQGVYERLRPLVIEECSRCQVYVPYSLIAKVVYMLILTITRKQYCSQLKLRPQTMKEAENQPVYHAALNILQTLQRTYDVQAEELDVQSLAVYLLCCQEILPDRFVRLACRNKIEALADGFIQYLDQIIPVCGYDLSEFRQNLCCNLAMLASRAANRFHMDWDLVADYKNDGLLNLDFCLILSEYLQKKTDLKVRLNDVLVFYPVFSLLMISLLKQHKKKVLIVSRHGYFYAGNLAQKFQNAESSYQIECLPAEYMKLSQMDMQDIDFIATDIGSVYRQYQPNSIQIHYFRTKKEFGTFFNEVCKPKILQKNNFFKPDNLIYACGIEDQHDFYNWLRPLLKKDQNVEEFIREVQRRSEILTPLRKNQIAVVKGIRDVLNRTFFYLIVLDKPIRWDEGVCSLVALYNVKGNDLVLMHYFSDFISRFIHKDNLEFTGNRSLDYSHLLQIIME